MVDIATTNAQRGELAAIEMLTGRPLVATDSLSLVRAFNSDEQFLHPHHAGLARSVFASIAAAGGSLIWLPRLGNFAAHNLAASLSSSQSTLICNF